MARISVEGRDVYTKTQGNQTVRICTAQNIRKEWEWEFELAAGRHVTPDEIAAHQTVAGLVEWLRARGARRIVTGSSVARPNPVAETLCVEPDPDWLSQAVPAVEQAINELVLEFVEHPYLHRVEHSLHVRLYQLLASHPVLGSRVSIGRSGYRTQLIHKEWPETTRRGEKNGRGNSDLAILSPNQLAEATLPEYRNGRVAAAIVIEMGLDYGFSHLDGDHKKLVNSEAGLGYLVDFRRSGRPDPGTRRLILDPEPPIRSAYVHHLSEGIAFKSVGDLELRYRQPAAGLRSIV
ncbi:hypothetical protein ACFY36_30995 [Actinoplanes sp. NPDC000266]